MNIKCRVPSSLLMTLMKLQQNARTWLLCQPEVMSPNRCQLWRVTGTPVSGSLANGSGLCPSHLSCSDSCRLTTSNICRFETVRIDGHRNVFYKASSFCVVSRSIRMRNMSDSILMSSCTTDAHSLNRGSFVS